MELYVLNFTKLWVKQICGRFSRGLSRDYVGLPWKVNNLKVCQLESLVHRQLGIYIWLARATFQKIQSGSKLVWIVIGISKTIWTAHTKCFNISGPSTSIWFWPLFLTSRPFNLFTCSIFDLLNSFFIWPKKLWGQIKKEAKRSKIEHMKRSRGKKKRSKSYTSRTPKSAFYISSLETALAIAF